MLRATVTRRRLTPADLRRLVRLYRAGKTLRQAGKAIGIYPAHALYHLRKLGEPIRNKSVARRRYRLNDAAFDRVTEHSAYWAGFLMADGCVWANTLTLELQARDVAHIRAFRLFLNATHPLRLAAPGSPGAQPTYRFKITSASITLALARFGVVARKTHVAKARRLQTNRHFWRGVLDGDGSILIDHRIDRRPDRPNPTRRTRHRLVLNGSRHLLGQFLVYAKTLCPNCTCSIRPHGASYRLSFADGQARVIARHLYHRCSIALARKAATARQIAKHRRQ